ncbi:MAG TPA: hypothetical protein VF103_10745, partial [Polyangiaceae bacterium]
MRTPAVLAIAVGVAGCGSPAAPAPPANSKPAPPAERAVIVPPTPGETHLANIRRITFGGENAEAYWSWSGR